jgi:signal transduction histidine kinase
VALSRRLTQEIPTQRALLEAESGSLEVMPSLSARDSSTPSPRSLRPTSRARQELVLEPPPAGEMNETDESLLMRVLINMTKNALEAIHPATKPVTVRFERLPMAAPPSASIIPA